MAPRVVVPATYISPEDGLATITFTDGLGFTAVFLYTYATGLVDIPARTGNVEQLLEQLQAFNEGNRKWVHDIASLFRLQAVQRGPLDISTEISGSGNDYKYKGKVAGLMLYNSVYHKDTKTVTLKPRPAASVTLAELMEFVDGNALGHAEAVRLKG